MSEFRPEEGSFDLGNVRIAVIAARWNAEITDGLLAGAIRALARHNISGDSVEQYRVPGAFELPLAAQRAARTGRFDAIITLGCVIRGDTPHFDYVCKAVTDGVVQLNLTLDVPVVFGVLTVDNETQAIERIGGAHGHKGEEAAITAIKMMALNRKLRNQK